MINTSELRIGNKVYSYKDEKIADVIVIEIDGLRAKIGDITVWRPEYYIAPIKLTEEIVLQLGFIKDDCIFHYAIPNSNHHFDIFIFKRKWCIDLDEFTTVIKSLHQLQNIYFTLFGKELNTDNITIND